MYLISSLVNPFHHTINAAILGCMLAKRLTLMWATQNDKESFGLEKTSKVIESNLLTNHHFVNWTTALTAMFSHLLDSFRDNYSTTSPGSLFQGLTTLFMKKFFLMSKLSLPWSSLRLCPLILSLVVWENRVVSTWLQPPYKEL